MFFRGGGGGGGVVHSVSALTGHCIWPKDEGVSNILVLIPWKREGDRIEKGSQTRT